MKDKGKNIAETVGNSQSVFRASRFEVRTIEIDGRSREFVAHPGAVVILPVIDADHIVMIRNERFAVGDELWELPAGTLEVNELPINTAYRELIEETGYQAAKIEPLCDFFTSPGICNELMYAFAAHGLVHVGQQLEETEKIRVEILAWKQILEMIRKGVICDGKTLSALMFYRLFQDAKSV